ncbi:MAG TPA: hypothetical protein VGC38_04885, partial [Pseudolabrys sp.]
FRQAQSHHGGHGEQVEQRIGDDGHGTPWQDGNLRGIKAQRAGRCQPRLRKSVLREALFA